MIKIQKKGDREAITDSPCPKTPWLLHFSVIGGAKVTDFSIFFILTSKNKA
jgi:hypothetical protein